MADEEGVLLFGFEGVGGLGELGEEVDVIGAGEFEACLEVGRVVSNPDLG